MNAHMKRLVRKVLSPFMRIGLKNRNFSIISNNCWGGYIYDIYGLKYLSPTIGLYFFSDDYIKFLEKIEYYLTIDCKPLNIDESKYKNYFNDQGIIPKLGIVGDIEIVFVHYSSSEEGCEKWNNRRKRVDFDNLLIKYNDQNSFKEENYYSFKKTNFLNKIFITANSKLVLTKDDYYIKKWEKYGYVKDDIKSSKGIVPYKKILNNLKTNNPSKD